MVCDKQINLKAVAAAALRPLTAGTFRVKVMDRQSPAEMVVAIVEKDVGDQRHQPSWCVLCERGLKPLLFNWFSAAMRLYNNLIKSNSYKMKKVLHAYMQLSTQSDDCWSAHIFLPRMTQSFIFNRSCKTVSPLVCSAVSSYTLGRDTWIFGQHILKRFLENTTANALICLTSSFSILVAQPAS